MQTIFEDLKICEAIKPQTMAGAKSGDWVSLKGYAGCLILVHIAQGNAATTAITVDKAKTAAGASNSDGITMKNWWKCEDAPATSDAFTKGAAAASITTSATGAGSSVYAIDIRAEDLGADYDFIQVETGASDVANILGATYILYGPRYAQSSPLSAIA